MHWDQLPPLRVEDCRYRLALDTELADGSAQCNLLTQAGIPREDCIISRDVCGACLKQFPPAPDCWNTVVSSLVYTRSRRALQLPSRTAEEKERLSHRLAEASSQLLLIDDGALASFEGPRERPIARSLVELLPPPGPRGRSRVRRWAVGVVSSPRRQPTLDATLESLVRAGWDSPCLFLDGTVRVAPRWANLSGVLREPRVGCWPNYYLALAELLMRQPDADAYLLVQDDTRFCDGEQLREYLEQMLWPDSRPCLVSLYCPSPYSAERFGWQRLARRWGLGALAFLFSRRMAQDFLLDRSVCDHRWGRWQEDGGGLANVDLVVGEWAWRKRVPIWYPTPSLVQHVGTASTLGEHRRAAGDRRADCWAGDLLPRGSP